MSTHYSPLRYPGGKAKLAKFLAKLLVDKANGKKIIFVEPFAGGAGAALSLLLTGKVSKIIINDLDPAIYTFWKVAIHDTDRLIRKIRRTEVTIAEWRKQQSIYKGRPENELKFAFATFFLNRANRSGIIEGGPIGGFEQSGEWKIAARFNKPELIRRLKLIQSFKDSIEVTNLDGIQLLKHIQKRKDSSNHFIFIDPPYIEKGNLLYLNHYKKNDHENLADFLKVSTLDWIMTYDDNSYVRRLYSEQQVKGFTISHTAYSRKKGKEVLISPGVIKGRVLVGL